MLFLLVFTVIILFIYFVIVRYSIKRNEEINKVFLCELDVIIKELKEVNERLDKIENNQDYFN